MKMEMAVIERKSLWGWHPAGIITCSNATKDCRRVRTPGGYSVLVRKEDLTIVASFDESQSETVLQGKNIPLLQGIRSTAEGGALPSSETLRELLEPAA